MNSVGFCRFFLAKKSSVAKERVICAVKVFSGHVFDRFFPAPTF
jgi:hypothetical protein